MLDGTRLRQSWFTALDDAQSNFRQLLTSFASPEWKRVVVPPESSARNTKGKAKASPVPEFTDVVIHRKVLKSGENVYRAVLEVTPDDGATSLDSWKSVLATPELRKEWDPAVESAQLLEMFDQATRISKVNFTLGWPANPRDAVMISRTFNDATTLIDISTSLPRSVDEPVYLRPSPPYVRSDVALFAWCIQSVPPSSSNDASKSGSSGKLRITCFWQHNLKLVWNFGSGSSLPQQLCAMTVGLFKSVTKRGTRIPLLTGYGNGVSFERVRFQIDREALTLDYSIVPEEEDQAHHTSEQGLDELHAIREHRRLTRTIECSLPSSEGWDIQITTRASSDQVAQLPWTAHAIRKAPSSQDAGSSSSAKIVFSVKHAALPNDHSVLKVKVAIELSGPSSGIRLNGIPQPVEELEDRDSSTYFISEQMLQDASSVADMSFNTQSSINTLATSTSKSSTIPERPQITRTPTERTAPAEKSILSRIKRSYIYFSSLLQEPEAKWRRTTENRGVSIAQLNSIDPTLVVYRAEATFVGVGLWDIYAAIVTPGARAFWDKLYDDAVLLEDVNELTELWHYKTKAAWPTNGRDAVVLKTVYKSPTTIHVFSFSADDPNLFPQIPPVDSALIRTQVDLQGWAIEALSPTTTLVTLLEQSDPKGWSNKATIPQQMVTAVAGVGEFAIKCGGPPVATRLDGAKAHEIRYDHDRGIFRIWYEGSPSRRSSSEKTAQSMPSSPSTPIIECEIRCDLDNWASSLDIVVDPPPQSISCLRRHRLSSGGGGLWLTISHDAVLAGDERLHVVVRRGPTSVSKDKGLVMVNGAKIDVDVEELPEREMKSLAKQKRVKPARVPLDQPPVLGVIRRRKAEWDADGGESDTADTGSAEKSPAAASSSTGVLTTAPKFASSFSRFFNLAVEQATTTTQQAVAAMSPSSVVAELIPSASKPPVQYALEALSYLQTLHARPSAEGWTLVSEKDFPIHRKLAPEISPVVPVHKGEKVIEGVSAEEVASVITSYDCRKQWDTRYDSAHLFEAYGGEVHTAFVVTKGGFPFRDRGFFLASLVARDGSSSNSSRRSPGETENTGDTRTPIFCVSASFSPDSVASFAPSKYNTYSLPIGRVYVDGWILETLDPYAAENYAIPSTRCTRVVAVDYSGSIPAAMNLMINGMLPKSILAVETYVKNMSPPPFSRLPAAGIVLSQATEDQPNTSWSLKRRDQSRTLIATKYNPADRVYCSVMLLNGARALPSVSADKTPRPSRIANSPLRGGTENSRPGRTGSVSSSAPSPDSVIQKAASTPPDRSRSRDQIRVSPAFTPRGELRHATDLLLSEVVVDSKLYPSGYAVELQSYIVKPKMAVDLPSPTAQFPGSVSLPITCMAYTLPPSPLHSASLTENRPARHLLRLTLSTAQYQMSTIQDPLTGETRRAPPKPQWLLELEEGRAVVEIVIKPASNGSSSKPSLTFNGNPVQLATEKESLTSLGRDELLDGRFSKMDLVIGSSAGADQFPEEYEHSIATSSYLLETSAEVTASAVAVEPTETDSASIATEQKEDVSHSDLTPASPGADRQSADTTANTILRFFNTYPNTLFGFSTPARRPSLKLDSSSEAIVTGKHEVGDNAGPSVVDVAVAQTAPFLRSVTRPTYPLSTVIIAALIAFLVGSLLRSLLSPADFIYLVTDRKEIDEGGAGWREIKRLLEVKYIMGGWDFQIAVVRRH